MIGFKKRYKKTRLQKFQAGQSGRVTLLIAMVPALIGVFASVITAYAGQRAIAHSESEKIIRTKLEEAYYKTLSYGEFATNLNTAALPGKLDVMSNLAMQKYNREVEAHNGLIKSVYSLIDLYGDNLEVPARKLEECSKEFAGYAADMFIMNYKIYQVTDYGSSQYGEMAKQYNLPVKQNLLVKKREDCINSAGELRKEIKIAMRNRLVTGFL